MTTRDDLRSEAQRTPGQYAQPVERGEFRNIYADAAGKERLGPRWSTREVALAAREPLPGETWVDCRNYANEAA